MPSNTKESSYSRFSLFGLFVFDSIKKAPSYCYNASKDVIDQLKENARRFKAKHIPSYALTIGAITNVGLLSFGGVLALCGGALGGPVLFIAFAALFLSVAYEGEIYVQNIKGSFKKLFKANYLERQLAKKCLLEDFRFTSGDKCPAFFNKYDELCAIAEGFQHKKLNEDSQKRKKRVEKQLSDMEKWFAEQLFASEPGKSKHQIEVREWVTKRHEGQDVSLRDKWNTIKTGHKVKFLGVKAFCSLDAILMSVGTSYLLVGLFMVVPFLAAVPFAIWPMLIVPLALFAGVAHGHMVYNAVTDTIVKDIADKWFNRIKENFKEGKRVRGAVIVLGLTSFLALTVALSIFTFGTWVTIVKTTPALFSFMRRLPNFIMSIVNPVVASVAVFLFNIQNISDTSEQIDNATDGTESVWGWLNAWVSMQITTIQDDFNTLRQQENWLQILNPFRMLAALYTPMRYMAFGGHIVSISVMGDQMKGVPAAASLVVGGANEIGEDFHYFVDLDGHGTCDIVQSNAVPSKETLAQLKMVSKTAFVRVINTDDDENSLYYVNKSAPKDKQFIKVNSLLIERIKFDSITKPTEKVRMLSNKQLKEIAKLFPHASHAHDKEALRRERLSDEHGHSHEADLPTKMLDVIFWPLHRLAATWDWAFSLCNKDKKYILTYSGALDKQLGREADENVEFKACADPNCITPHSVFVPISKPTSHVEDDTGVNPVASVSLLTPKNLTLKERKAAQQMQQMQQMDNLFLAQFTVLPTSTESQSSAQNVVPLVNVRGSDSVSIPSSVNEKEIDHSWMVEHAVYLIDKHKKKHLQGAWVGRDIEKAKKDGLTSLQEGLEKHNDPKQALNALRKTEAGKSGNNKHRFFFNQIKGDTDTVLFLEGLAERVAPIAGAA
jgi:hypothetical protein